MNETERRFRYSLKKLILVLTGVAVAMMVTAWFGRWLNQPRTVLILRDPTFLAEHSEPITVAAFSPDGKVLAASDYKHNRRIPTEVIVWRISNKPAQVCVFDGPEMQCHALCFHPDGKLLAIGGEGGFVKIADVQEQAIVRTFEIDGSPPSPHMGIDLRAVRAMQFSPDGEVLAIATERREVEIWSTDDWQRLHILPRHSDVVNDLAFSADGARMLSVGGRWESIPDTNTMRRRPEVFEWDTTTWKKVGELEIPEATGFARRVVYLGAVIATLDAHENLIMELAFDGPRDLLISTSAEQTIVWDVWRHAQAATFDGAGFFAYNPTREIFAAAFASSYKSATLLKVVVNE